MPISNGKKTLLLIECSRIIPEVGFKPDDSSCRERRLKPTTKFSSQEWSGEERSKVDPIFQNVLRAWPAIRSSERSLAEPCFGKASEDPFLFSCRPDSPLRTLDTATRAVSLAIPP